jgi:hypothetical protein
MRSRTFLLFTALLSAGSGSMPAMAQVTLQPAPVTAHPHAAFIAEASQRFGIPEHWIRAVLRVESAGDVRAISSAGAMGLMQVMPDTWAGLRRRHGLGRDPYDPRDNIFAGTAYLREMWDRYGNVAAMLAAYNAGPGRYDEHLATGRTLPAETRAYVATLAPASWACDCARCADDRAATTTGLARSPALRCAIRRPFSDGQSTVGRRPRNRSSARFRRSGAAGQRHIRGPCGRWRQAMSMVSSRTFGPFPVCSQARGRLAAFPAGRAKRGRKGGGQDKGNRHPVGAVSGQALACTLFWDAAHGTMLLGLACRDMAQSLGVAGF